MNRFEKLSAFLEGAKGEESKRGRGVTAYAGATAIPTAGAFAYMKGIGGGIRKPSFTDAGVAERILADSGTGAKVLTNAQFRNKVRNSFEYSLQPEFMQNMLLRKFRKNLGVTMPGADNATIVIPRGMRGHTGVLAHELGHAQQLKKYKTPGMIGYRQATGAAAGIGTMVAAFSKDEDRAKKGAIAGTLGGIGLVGQEVGASARGARLLGKAGVKGMRRWSPYIGIPTYAALALAPALAYLIKRSLGGYSKTDK